MLRRVANIAAGYQNLRKRVMPSRCPDGLKHLLSSREVIVERAARHLGLDDKIVDSSLLGSSLRNDLGACSDQPIAHLRAPHFADFGPAHRCPAAVAVWHSSSVTPLKYTIIVYIDISRSSRSEEHTSELQSLMRISYAVFCLKKKINI